MGIGAVVPIATGIIGDRFKPPTPRVYGRLPATIRELQEGVEGKVANINNRTYNAVETVQLMDSERKSDSGMQGIWSELLPTWSPTPAALAEIRRLDPGLLPRGGSGGAGSSGGTPDLSGEQPAPDGSKPASAAGMFATHPMLFLVVALAAGFLVYKATRK